MTNETPDALPVTGKPPIVKLGDLEIPLADFAHVIGLHKRKGYDCLMDNGSTIQLDSMEQYEQAVKNGMKFVLSTPRTGYDIVFSNNLRITIREEDKAEFERAMEIHQTTLALIGYLEGRGAK